MVLFDSRGLTGADVTTLTFDYPDRFIVSEHFYDQAQLVCRGVMTVNTREGTWVVPAQRAGWVPGE